MEQEPSGRVWEMARSRSRENREAFAFGEEWVRPWEKRPAAHGCLVLCVKLEREGQVSHPWGMLRRS